jgi:hypothetical protein
LFSENIEDEKSRETLSFKCTREIIYPYICGRRVARKQGKSTIILTKISKDYHSINFDRLEEKASSDVPFHRAGYQLKDFVDIVFLSRGVIV